MRLKRVPLETQPWKWFLRLGALMPGPLNEAQIDI